MATLAGTTLEVYTQPDFSCYWLLLIKSEKFLIGVQPGAQINWILKTLLNILLWFLLSFTVAQFNWMLKTVLNILWRFLLSFTGCPTVLQKSIEKSIEYYSIEFSLFNWIEPQSDQFQVQLPLFFLLSGFCLTLGYGKKKYDSAPLCFGPCAANSEYQTLPSSTDKEEGEALCDCAQCLDEKPVLFDSRGFYYGRLARIYPVYLVTYLFAIMLIPLGYNRGHISDFSQPGTLRSNVWGTISALYGVQTWILNFGFGPYGPSWTVSTLFFFYLVFPK